jgi:hypothetical protein
MAKDSYKKRMKGSWNQGKEHKGDRCERAYAKTEIRELIKEMDDDYQTKYKKAKRNRNEKARLEHKIKWCEETLAKKNGSECSYLSNWVKSELEKAKQKYAVKYGDDK